MIILVEKESLCRSNRLENLTKPTNIHIIFNELKSIGMKGRHWRISFSAILMGQVCVSSQIEKNLSYTS